MIVILTCERLRIVDGTEKMESQAHISRFLASEFSQPHSQVALCVAFSELQIMCASKSLSRNRLGDLKRGALPLNSAQLRLKDIQT